MVITMHSKPGPGTFFAISAGLICLLAGVAPWPGRFNDPGGGAAPGRSTPVRCLGLSYSGVDYRWLPTTIRLLPQQYFTLPAQAPWYRTSGPGGSSWTWRPAGPDSIDLAGHHGPVLRIPSSGDRVTGRGGWPQHGNLLDAMSSTEWRVHAAAVPCSTMEE